MASDDNASRSAPPAGGSAELRTFRDVLKLARGEGRFAAIAMSLAIAAAFFEGLGLSLLIPLVELLSVGEVRTRIPVIGPLLERTGIASPENPLVVVGIILATFVTGIIVGLINKLVSIYLAIRFAHRLRLDVFDRVVTLPISTIEGLPSGKMLNNLTNVPWQVCDALFVVIGMLVNLAACMVFLWFLVSLSPLYTAVLALLIAVNAVLVYWATHSVLGLGEAAKQAHEDFLALTWDALSGLRTIRGFGRDRHEKERYERQSLTMSRILMRFDFRSSLVSPISQATIIVIVCAMLALAVLRDDPISMLIGFLALAYRMQPRVSGILSARTALRGASAPVAEMMGTLSLAAAEPAAPRTRLEGRLRDGITLKKVSVRYPRAQLAAVQDVTCSFRYGEVTAVAGRSGAGKSTIAAVLMRFVTPESGSVTVDGVPLNALDPADWHARIAFVEQNAFLFNATVRENIRYGRLDASDAEIAEAARDAEAHEFIAGLPQGMDTMIGNAGVQLSLGQRQRVALARALLRDPEVLILDEATNALDRPTDLVLRNAIHRQKARRLTIVIAHRRETIETADRVIVLEEGRVVQNDAPTTLANRKGAYATLYLD
jgi:ATP-binding cassette, subfamily B, bacterial MsbA